MINPPVRPNPTVRSSYADSDNKRAGVADVDPQDSCDKDINCVQCSNDFLFSAVQQIDYKKKGYEHDPKRCPKCRGQVCDSFKDTGSCRFGDDCKFLHVSGSQPAAAGAPIQEESNKMNKYPCVFFDAGRCQRGDNCTFEHVKKEEGSRPNSTVHSIRFAEPSADDYVVYPM